MSGETGGRDDQPPEERSNPQSESDRCRSADGSVTRRRALSAAVGTLGAATAGWSLVGEPAPSTASAGGASETPGTSNESTSLARVSSEEWLQLHRDDEAEQISTRHWRDGRTPGPQSLGVTRSPTSTRTDSATATATETATPTATPAPYETTQELLFEGTSLEQPLYRIEGREPGPTGFVVAGMHGDEQAGFRAAGQVARWGVRRGTLVVLPAANPPAIERGTRYGDHGDLNRQFPPTDDRSPETRLAEGLWAVLRDHDPDWVADLHSSYGIYLSGDGGVGQAIYPTTVDPAERYATEATRAINRSLGLDGVLRYRRGNLLDGDRPMLVHRAGAVRDVPGFILETTERVSLERQIDWHLFSMDQLIYKFSHDPIL